MRRRTRVSLCVLFFGVFGWSSTAAGELGWDDLRTLVGQWSGEGSGFGVVSDVTHTWESIFGDNFLRLTTRSAPRGGAGEIHKDVGYLSLNRDSGMMVFRQFLSEGFVNTFDVMLEPGDEPGILFDHRESESSGGMRARMRVTLLSEGEYEMVLELAVKGEDYAPCQRMVLKRVE